MPKKQDHDDEDDLLLALQNMEPCGNCGADGAKVPCMSGCKEVFYCSQVRSNVAKSFIWISQIKCGTQIGMYDASRFGSSFALS